MSTALTIEKLLTPYNRDVTNGREILYLVFHYVGALGGAKANAEYYASKKIGASAHFFVDEKPVIFQGVEDKDVSWHCGGVPVYLHPVCRNFNSIGVEMCVKKVNTGQQYATDTDWYFLPETVDNAVELGRMLMAKYGIPIDRVLRHYDVTGKYCPNPFMVNAKAQAAWEDFKARLIAPESEEIDMDKNELMDIVREAVREAQPPVYETLEDVPAWGVPTIQRFISAGALRGDEKGRLNLTSDLLRALVILDRVQNAAGTAAQGV